MFSGFIFDMDGTMFDTERMLAKYWHIAAEEFGYNMTIDHSVAIRSTSPEESAKILRGFFGKDFNYIAVRNRRRELMNEYIENHHLPKKKGLMEILSYAKENGIKTAVATATDKKRTLWYLEKENLIWYIDKIATTQMVARGKPYPDIYIYAAKILGLEPEDTIAFEDSPKGLQSSYRAGCKPFMIPDLTDSDAETDKILFHKSKDFLEALEFIKKYREEE